MYTQLGFCAAWPRQLGGKGGWGHKMPTCMDCMRGPKAAARTQPLRPAPHTRFPAVMRRTHHRSLLEPWDTSMLLQQVSATARVQHLCVCGLTKP